MHVMQPYAPVQVRECIFPQILYISSIDLCIAFSHYHMIKLNLKGSPSHASWSLPL